MTSKERVQRALNHQEVDRVPIDLGGTASCILDDAYLRLKEYLGLTGEPEIFRRGSNTSYYDEELLDYFEIDIRRVFAKVKEKYPIINEDGSFTNEWGIVQKKGQFGVEMVKNPLAKAKIEDLEAFPWPKPELTLERGEMKERAQKIYQEGKYALALRAPCNGIFEISCWLRGTENFMMDMLCDEEFAHALTEKVLETQIAWYNYLLEEIGEYVDIVETSDDYGSQNSLLLSPECLDSFILNRRKRLNDAINKKAPNAKIFLHCCGSIARVVDALLESGVDILNPVQTCAKDMDPYMLKREFGDKITFHGGIDTQKSMRGNKEMVEQEVAHMLDAMKGNGGYILASCNHIQDDVPLENIVAMFETAKRLSVNPDFEESGE
jgi:Uroporphyrinogen-III decarboxylase